MFQASKVMDLKYGPKPSKEDLNQLYDFCIVGSGASGATVASILANKGFLILLLECGPYVDNTITYDQLLQQSEMAYARSENGCWSLIGYPWTTSNVGGGTVYYGGASFRYREVDFNATSYTYTDLQVKWPYQYSELADYYTIIEASIGVSGDPKKDPTSPSNYSLPLPPIKFSTEGLYICEGAVKLGLNPFPTPMAILSQPYDGRNACGNSSACIEQYCANNSKSDVVNTFLKNKLKLKNLKLFAGLKVLKLIRKNEHEVSQVFAKHMVSGENYEFRAKVFVLACNAIQTAALLLRSKDKWSNGIGNNYDLIGKGFCQKLSHYVVGYLPLKNVKGNNIKYNSGPFSTVSITDYYIHNDIPTKLGGLIYETKIGTKFSYPDNVLILRMECMIADTPQLSNSISICGSDIERSKIIMDYKPHPLDLIRLRYLIDFAKDILIATGCRKVYEENSGCLLGSTHLHGTCRYGLSPSVGVVDKYSRVYGIDNLYIADGAIMPYPGAVNPTLTIQAHAAKLSYYLYQHYR